MLTTQEFDDLFETHGNVAAIARNQLVSRQTIYNWMREIDYSPPKKRPRKKQYTRVSRSAPPVQWDTPIIESEPPSIEFIPNAISFAEVKEFVYSIQDQDDPRVRSWRLSVDSNKRAGLIADTIRFINSMLQLKRYTANRDILMSSDYMTRSRSTTDHQNSSNLNCLGVERGPDEEACVDCVDNASVNATYAVAESPEERVDRIRTLRRAFDEGQIEFPHDHPPEE